jgi:hypothetical protein
LPLVSAETNHEMPCAKVPTKVFSTKIIGVMETASTKHCRIVREKAKSVE